MNSLCLQQGMEWILCVCNKIQNAFSLCATRYWIKSLCLQQGIDSSLFVCNKTENAFSLSLSLAGLLCKPPLPFPSVKSLSHGRDIPRMNTRRYQVDVIHSMISTIYVRWQVHASYEPVSYTRGGPPYEVHTCHVWNSLYETHTYEACGPHVDLMYETHTCGPPYEAHTCHVWDSSYETHTCEACGPHVWNTYLRGMWTSCMKHTLTRHLDLMHETHTYEACGPRYEACHTHTWYVWEIWDTYTW